jgi:hypothetical protein
MPHFDWRVRKFLTLMLLATAVLFCVPSVGWGAMAHKKYATEALEVCNECHKDMNVALNHNAPWVNEHRPLALRADANCKQCHEQSFCTDCHYGGGIDADLHVSAFGANYSPYSHRTNFRELHPIKAMDDPSSCNRCHNNVQFCSNCHSKFNPTDLAIISHRKSWSGLQVQAGGAAHSTFGSTQCQQCHPNSLLPTNVWSTQHAREARENLSSCQSCHADGAVCLTCHSAKSGLMNNPHPKGWAGIAGKLSDANGGKTCKVCH